MTSQMTNCWDLWISAGTGPIEVRRMVPLLADVLARACERAGLELIDRGGDLDQAPRSLRLRVRGHADRALGDWLGTHAIVHDSRRERGGRHRGHRKRWFVSVSLTAVHDSKRKHQRLDRRELDVCFARSGGPGGQHVNTSSTAVRVQHRPTGIAVRVSDSRSQAHNRELALVRLADRLRERESVREREQASTARSRRCAVTRGQAVASWRLDPRSGDLCPA